MNKVRSGVFTIMLKLVMAFGTCVLLMLLAGLSGTISFVRVGSLASVLDRWLMIWQVVLALGRHVVAACFGVHLIRVVCEGLDRMARKFEEVAVSQEY
jgi:hypothetical protein